MFWGFSESKNLLQEFKKATESDPEEVNILLFGGGDQRFILEALAKSYSTSTKVNFYVLEGCIELVARHLVLLSIALENPTQLTLKGKTHLYMDVFGNTLLRPSSYMYLCSKASHLTKLITDFDFATQVAPIFSLDRLKYKERDALENTFKFWTHKPNHLFQIETFWETRLRQLLGVRYDSRTGAFDWDLQMRLKEYGAKTISSQEYKVFRERGIAFTFPEYEQTYPNKTFAVGLTRTGNQFAHRGCVGDMTVGPYIPYGIACKDESFLKQSHGVGQFRATDITERNLFEVMFEIQERREYEHDPKNVHAYGSVYLAEGRLLTEHQNVDEVELEPFDQPCIPVANVKVNFLSIEDVLTIQTSEAFRGMFDVVFVAANYFPFVKPELKDILKEKALVYFETRRYSTMNKKEISEFLQKIKDFGKSIGLRALTNFSINLPYSTVKYCNFE